MPWARIPPNKLINLPLFGIDVIADDGDFVWMSGARGRMHVDKGSPKIFFEDIADAHQAGATSIMIGSQAEAERYQEMLAAQLENEAPAGESDPADEISTGADGQAK
jgi:hypothetical protein